MLQQECSVFMGENMKLNEIYYEEFLNRAEELEAFMTVPKAKDAAGFRYALWRRRCAACPE